MTVITSLGAQAAYKPPQKVLRDEDRSVTDGNYKIVFCIISTIWLAACICALSCSAHEKSSLQNRNITKNITHHYSANTKNITHHHSTSKNNTTSNSTVEWSKSLFFFFLDRDVNFDLFYRDRGSVIFWASIIFYTALILLAMKFMHCWATMSPPALIVMSSTMITVSIIYHIVQYLVNDTDALEPLYKKLMYWAGPEAVLFVLSILIFFNVMRSSGVSAMIDLLKDAFRFYGTCRYLPIVGFSIAAIISVLNIFTSIVLRNFSVKGIESKIIYLIIYCGSCYLIIVAQALGKMVISAAAATYYWNENDDQSPFKVMCQKIVSISKYQFGSACCKATFTSLWFIPVINILFGYEFQYFRTAIGYCLIFDVVQLLAFDNEVFLIGMYGVSSSEASDLFFYLFRKLPKIITYTCQGLWSSTFIILLPTNCIMLILTWGLNDDDQMFSFVSSKSYYEITAISLPILFVLGTIEDARCICVMKGMAEKEELKDDESLEEPKQVKIITDSEADSKTNEIQQISKTVPDENNKK